MLFLRILAAHLHDCCGLSSGQKSKVKYSSYPAHLHIINSLPVSVHFDFSPAVASDVLFSS